MKTYYFISLVLFTLLYTGLAIAKFVLGGETKVPIGWSIFVGIIILNTIISMVCFVRDMVRNKI
jgi:hypothetical protein